jgi:short-subunit dehydrogenase
MELKPWGIHVSTLNPGFMRTEIANKGPDSACPQAHELYPYMKGFMEYMRDHIANGSQLTVTSNAIIHAITSPRPKANYILSYMDGGMPSWALIWLSRMLPTECNEAIILSAVQQYDPHRADNQVCDSASVCIPEQIIDPEQNK